MEIDEKIYEKLYDKSYVYFEWDESLRGKFGYLADTLDELKEMVYNPFFEKYEFFPTMESSMISSIHGDHYNFAYYDPNYRVKIAFLEGRLIQKRTICSDEWENVTETDFDKINWKTYMIVYRIAFEKE